MDATVLSAVGLDPSWQNDYSRPWAGGKEHTNENSSRKKKKKSARLSQAKHLLSILMGINGRAGTGDRGVDWLAGPVLTQPPLSILPALLFTANTSCCALPHTLHQLMCISVLRVCVCVQWTHMFMMHHIVCACINIMNVSIVCVAFNCTNYGERASSVHVQQIALLLSVSMCVV